MAVKSITAFLGASPLLKACGTLAADAITFGLMKRKVEREKLELQLQMAFPEDWQVLLDAMDRFDRASTTLVSVYVRQMWTCGVCRLEELLNLYEQCPAAFRGHDFKALVGKPANEVLPMLVENLP